MRASDWIMSEGGPLMIVDPEAAHCWGGVLARKSADPRFANDYEQACEVTGYLEKVRVNDGFALIVGDAPLDTCVWRDNEGTLHLVRVWYCETDFDVDLTMTACPRSLFENAIEILPYEVGSPDLIMFDSAEPGDDPDKKFVRFRLATGAYHILTQTWDPDTATSLVVHRFDRMRVQGASASALPRRRLPLKARP